MDTTACARPHPERRHGAGGAARRARPGAGAARTRAEFISHASHEIRTPLHGIVGYSTLLLGTELTDEQRELANALRMGVESLLSIVSDVLDVSRLDAGAMALEKTGFDLTALVRGVTRSFEETARAAGIWPSRSTPMPWHTRT